jgi:hypothetical protein
MPRKAPKLASAAVRQAGDYAAPVLVEPAGGPVPQHRDGNQLKQYWLHGEGAAKWSTWTQLYNHLKKHVPAEQAKRIAAQWFHDRYGYWPGHQKGSNPTGPG